MTTTRPSWGDASPFDRRALALAVVGLLALLLGSGLSRAGLPCVVFAEPCGSDAHPPAREAREPARPAPLEPSCTPPGRHAPIVC